MGKFTAFIKGQNEDGKRYTDRVTVRVKDQDAAKRAVENMLLDDEKIVYVGPGDNGDEIPPARG